MNKPKWVETNDFLIVTFENQKPLQLRKGSGKYNVSKKLLDEEQFDELYDFCFAKATKISTATKGLFRIEGSNVFIGNDVLPAVLSQKLLGLFNSGSPFEPLVRFWKRLTLNPDPRIREQLFGFLQASHIPLTPDGCFLAYKSVTNLNGHLWDSYSKTIRNDIGDKPKMVRSEVDSDPTTTCSHGLHVASYNYAVKVYGCGNSNAVTVEVKIDPKDVCAVPTDYNNEKMRVCQYEVVSLNKSPIVDEYLAPSVLRIKKKLSKKALKTEQNKVDKTPVALGDLTAKGIIDLVKERTGVEIKIDLKSKKAIIKKALEVFRQYNIPRSVSFKDKTASELISLVQTELGIVLEMNPKNKQGIINKAINLFQGHGFKIKK